MAELNRNGQVNTYFSIKNNDYSSSIGTGFLDESKMAQYVLDVFQGMPIIVTHSDSIF